MLLLLVLLELMRRLVLRISLYIITINLLEALRRLIFGVKGVNSPPNISLTICTFHVCFLRLRHIWIVISILNYFAIEDSKGWTNFWLLLLLDRAHVDRVRLFDEGVLGDTRFIAG